MSSYSSYPALYGDDLLVGSARLLAFVRSPRLSSIAESISERAELFVDACRQVIESFDVENGAGEQLDRLGALLQRPRYGASDEHYRRLLQIQIEIILSSTTSTAAVQRIVELYTELAPTAYAEHDPMSYEIGATVNLGADSRELYQLLRQATAAAYGVTLLASPAGGFVADYTPETPIADASSTDYTPETPIAGAEPVGYPHAP